MLKDVQTIAETVRQAHEPGVLAILAYGSALREGGTRNGLIDLYILTRNYKSVSRNIISCLFCRLIPPNVYYAEANGLRAKYAMLPLKQFARLARASNPYIWARFGQPCKVIFTADRQSGEALAQALQDCRATLWRQASAASEAGDDALKALERLLRQTYATELRPESSGRANLIIQADREWYEAEAARHLGAGWRSENASPQSWLLHRITGKALSVARLIKAGFTFQGGADYMAWKIERHSGVKLTITDWQRRHPILGALSLLPQVLRNKAIR